eukprot:TCONS_00018439-protein
MLRRIFKRKPKAPESTSNGRRRSSEIHLTEEEKDGLIVTNVNNDEDKTDNYDELSFIVDYIGSDYVSEAQSVPLLMETLKRIKKQHHKTIRVDLVLKSGILKVIDNEQSGALLITAPLYAIALAAQEQLRGFETAFALNITRRRIHMCHVFQAGSRLEATAIVRAIAVSFRSVAKDLKEKRENAGERVRSDSERAHSDTDAVRKHGETVLDVVDATSTSHQKRKKFVPSEEDIVEGDKASDEEIVSVLVHQSTDTVEQEAEESGKNKKPRGDSIEIQSEKSVDVPVIDLFEKALQAIQQHDLKLLERCIDEGLSVDAIITSTSLTLLHHAVINNNAEITEFLLDKGADVNKEGPKDQTALHFAAANGNGPIAMVLLAHNANVRATDSKFHTPLHLSAANLQSLQVSVILVEHGARIEDNDIEGDRPVDLHPDLREIQNRLIQSNIDTFASAEIDRSRSNSNCSSTSSSFKSVSRSPSNSTNKMAYNRSPWRLRASSSLQSIRDVDGDSLSPMSHRKTDIVSPSPASLRKETDEEILSDVIPTNKIASSISSPDPTKSDQEDREVLSGYSSARRDSTTDDSEFEARVVKGEFFSDDGIVTESEDEIRNMRDLIDQKTLHSGKGGLPGMSESFGKISRKNTVTNSLGLLVTLSGNAECQSSILAHLCLPKASQQLINLAHSVVASTTNLTQIAQMLHNLFTVSGPSGRKKCFDAGLLKTVVDLLDATEPIQSTCLQILNDMFKTENERDYSGNMSGIPIEPLLTIVKNNDTDSYITDVISDQNTLNDKMKTRISRSSDSGYPNSPSLVERSASIKKRNEDSDSSDVGTNGIASFSRSKSKIKNDSIPLSNLESSIGRGRSQSFNSSVDTINSVRDSSPSVNLRVNNGRYNSESESNSSSGHYNSTKARRISKGSTCSVDNPISRPTSTRVGARHIAMKMLAASSRSHKLQEELAKPQILKLLLGCLVDPDDEIILQATETLANIAMNIETHLQLQVENTDEALFKLVDHNNLKIQYQAARGLVYLGHTDINDKYIYDYISGEDSNSTVVYMEEDGRSHIRGSTVENLVLTLTQPKGIYLLWGGAHNLPPSPNQRKSLRHTSSKSRSKTIPSENQIINFILSTYQTFVHPIIFMRLLLHRFREPNAYKMFHLIQDEQQGPMEHYAPLPIIHARLMRVWICWLENYAQDFVTFPTLKDELSILTNPMRSIDGPYAPCASKLEQLLFKVADTASANTNVYRFESESHHNILYEQCYKAIKEGKLPCSEDDCVYLISLQLYIEDICLYGQDFPQRLKTIESITMTRLKQNFGSAILSSKHLLKRIKSQYEIIVSEQPTERNAKHNFVDCCQGMSGYGCTFFKVKQRIPNSRSRKKFHISRLFGISAHRIVLLDDRTKVCVEKFHPKYLHRTEQLEDSLTVKIILNRNKTNNRVIEMQLENRLIFKELSNHILTCRMEVNFQGYENIDTQPWSLLSENLGTWGNMALQLHTSKNKTELIDDFSGEDNRKRGRSTTTTNYPMSRLPNSTGVISSSAPKNYSHSAPAKQESSGWSGNAYEVLSFLNLKGILRSRGGGGETPIVHPGSESNSEAGTPPHKDGVLGDSFSTTPPSHGSSIAMEAVGPSQRRGSRVSASQAHENTPMLDESHGTDHQDPSKFAHATKMLTCQCPPDAVFDYLNLKEFSAFELLDHPKELARQITLIDHRMFCSITSKDVLFRISLGSIKRHQKAESHVTVEKFAHRFNQMSNWIVNCIVSERNIHRRAKLFKNFIETAKQCLELRNYNAVTAIIVAALGSAPVRRLVGTKELVEPEYLSWMHKMENLMDSRSNHKKYRETLRSSQTPAIPYFGIYLKDLTFITDGNPDYLKGGVVNLSKRRQVHVLLEEIRRFQKKRYNFQEVQEIREYLLSKSFVSEDKLHQMSKKNEPTINSRFGSSYQSVSHYQYSDRRSSSSATTLFRSGTNSRSSTRRSQQKGTPSATSV